MELFVIENMFPIDEELLNKGLSLLPASRLEYANKYKRTQDRALCVYSYLLLKFALRKKYDMTFVPEFTYTKYNKPMFDKFSDIHFNISHCSKGVCCGLSSNEIGVDIQNIEDYNVMKFVMCENEQMLIKNSENPKGVFTQLWSLKESYFKMKGTGICDEMKKTDFSYIISKNKNIYQNTLIYTFKGDGYYIAASSLNEIDVKINFIDVKCEELYKK